MNFPEALLDVNRDNGMKVIVIEVTGIWTFCKHVRSHRFSVFPTGLGRILKFCTASV